MRIKLTVLMSFLLACAVVPAFAEEAAVATAELGENVEAVAVEEAIEAEAEVVRVNNKFCPTDGGDVTAMGGAFEVTHDGKVYNLCCAACEKEFRANLEKYTKIAEESEKIEIASQDVEAEGMIAEEAVEETVEAAQAQETHGAAY